MSNSEGTEVKCTNEYGRDRLAPSMVRDVTVAEMMRFFAALQYMGVVVLKSKEDYFQKNHPVLPSHHAYFGHWYRIPTFRYL